MNTQKFIDNYNKTKRIYFVPILIILLFFIQTPYIYLTILFLIIFLLGLFKVNKLDTLKNEIIHIADQISNLNYDIPINTLNKFNLRLKDGVFNQLNDQLFFYSTYLKIILLIMNKKFNDAEKNLLLLLKYKNSYGLQSFIPCFNDTIIDNKRILYYLILESKVHKNTNLKNIISILIQEGCYLNNHELNELSLSKKEKDSYVNRFNEYMIIEEENISSKDIFRILQK